MMSFQKSISKTLVFGQLLCLMPISGITSRDPIDLKFKWKSFRFIYCVVLTFIVFLLLVSFVVWIFRYNEFSLDNINILVIYFTHIATILMFFKIGKKWPKLVTTWTELERSFPSSGVGNHLHNQLSLRLLIACTSAISKLSCTVT